MIETVGMILVMLFVEAVTSLLATFAFEYDKEYFKDALPFGMGITMLLMTVVYCVGMR